MDAERDLQATAGGGGWLRGLARAFVNPDSYGLVLLLIMATYLIASQTSGRWTGVAVVLAQIVTVWLALRTSRTRKPLRVAADVVLAAAAIAAVASLLSPDERVLLGLVAIASCVLYFIAPFAIMRNLLTRDRIDRQTVLGAIAAYLMIGLFFGFLYRLMAAAHEPAAFFGASGAGTLQECLFFSFTTLTTTGYGNLVPASSIGQSVATLEMVFGQLFLVTAVAKVVTSWKPTPRKGDGGSPA